MPGSVEPANAVRTRPLRGSFLWVRAPGSTSGAGWAGVPVGERCHLVPATGVGILCPRLWRSCVGVAVGYPRRHTGYGIPRRSRPMGQGWTEERPPMGSGIPPISSVAAWLIRVGGLSVVSPTGEPREPCSRHGVVKGGGACFRINTWRVFRGRALIEGRPARSSVSSLQSLVTTGLKPSLAD